MPIHVSDKQLDQVESGRTPAVIVKSERTKKGYALIPEQVYDQLRPLLQYVRLHVDASPQHTDNCKTPEWAQEFNARRVALIMKKHEKGLTAAERKELK